MRVVTPPARLSAKQKAAVIVRLLLTQNLSPGISRLHPQLQADLARTMAQLGPVNRATRRRWCKTLPPNSMRWR